MSIYYLGPCSFCNQEIKGLLLIVCAVMLQNYYEGTNKTTPVILPAGGEDSWLLLPSLVSSPEFSIQIQKIREKYQNSTIDQGMEQIFM